MKIKLPIENESDLDAFCQHVLGINIPKKQVCPEHVAPWDAFCAAFFARDPISIWWSTRGFGGKSTLLAALALCEAVALGGDVSILGGSYQQSLHVRKYIQGYLRRRSLRGWAAVETQGAVTLQNGAEIVSLAASQTSVRGPHPQRLRMDEVDEMELNILEAALGQPMGKEGVPSQTVLSSTWQYPDGTMAEMLRRATERGWPIYSWCWKETMQPHGWLPPKEVERKRETISANMWAVEYDLQQPSAENRAILPEAVEDAFSAELGTFEGASGEVIETEPPESNATYVHGADLARKRDYTVLVTLRTDVKPARVVSFLRLNRLPWLIMMGKVNARIKRYPGRLMYDATGVGDAAGEFLADRAEAVVMVGRARQDLLGNYITAIEKGEMLWPLINVAKKEHLYASTDDVFGSGHLPDTFAAGALAWMRLQKGSGKVSWIADPFAVWPPPEGHVYDTQRGWVTPNKYKRHSPGATGSQDCLHRTAGCDECERELEKSGWYEQQHQAEALITPMGLDEFEQWQDQLRAPKVPPSGEEIAGEMLWREIMKNVRRDAQGR